MPRIKPKRSTPRLDMTPMVDLAFLLVTFFMLTTKFRPDEPVVVDIPAAVDTIQLPQLHVFLITVAQDGRVFVDMDGKFKRQDWIEKLNDQYKLGLNDDEMNTFSNMSSVGVPMNKLKGFIDLPTAERKAYHQEGIPVDSAHNELSNYMLYARLADPKLTIAIKGDKDAQYKDIKDVIADVQSGPNGVNSFNLITTLASGPPK